MICENRKKPLREAKFMLMRSTVIGKPRFERGERVGELLMISATFRSREKAKINADSSFLVKASVIHGSVMESRSDLAEVLIIYNPN